MKSLLLDAGNSRLKWVLSEHGELSHRGALSYEWPRLSAQLDASLGKMIREAGPLVGIVLCNVAGEKLKSVLQDKLADCWRRSPAQENNPMTITNVIAQSAAFGVRSAYEQPEQFGADRWASLVAARQHLEGAGCIIDSGTALTVDVINEEGRHVGGIIVPGMEMMMSSLSANTDGICASRGAENSPLGVTNTADAVRAGVMAAMHGAVQQVLQHCRDELGEEPVCVVTGGNAEFLLAGLPESAIYEPDWVLRGLAIIADGDQQLP